MNLIISFLVSFPALAQEQNETIRNELSRPPRPAGSPAAKIQGLTLQADNLMRDHDRELVELSGSVQIIRGDQHISCDRALIYLKSKKLELFGGVSVVSSKQTLKGEEILLDYETGTGLIRDGYVKSGQVLFEGNLIQKTGEDEYFVSNANYTSCTNCPATWSFSGQQIRAELGGYAYIKNSVMRIGGLPILWLPYLVVPLKSDRQSGLLTPNFGFTRQGGSEFEQPYFWAIDRSSDMTFTLKTFEKRQLMGMTNYRYVLSDSSKGELDTHWIRDRAFTRSGTPFRRFHPAKESFNRWYVYYQHYLEQDEGWTQRMNLHNASDLRYMRDFERETNQRALSEPALENRINFSKNSDDLHFHFDTSYYVNLLRADPLANNNDAVHRLPEISLSKPQQKISDTPFRYSWDLTYVNFARSSRSYDDLTRPSPTNPNDPAFPDNTSPSQPGGSPLCDDDPNCRYVFDGRYDSGDLIRTGQRIDFRPQMHANFLLGRAFEFSPRLTYRDTQYFFPVGEKSHVARRYLKTDLTSRMSFSQIFGDTDPRSTRYKHVLEPEITYTNIPWLDLGRSDFFSRQATISPLFNSATPVSDRDLTGGLGIQFDENDRIFDRNLLTFSLTNRLIERFWGGDSNQYRQVVRFRLSQSYNLARDGLRPGQSRWSDLAGVLTVRFDNVETNTNINYFPDQKVTNIQTRTAFMNNKGQFFEVGFDRLYTIVQGQDAIRSTRVEDISFGLGFTTGALNLAGQVVYDANWRNAAAVTNRSEIKSWGYVMQLKPPGECWQVNLTQGQRVGGNARIDIGFEYNFDGVPKPPPPRSILNQFRN